MALDDIHVKLARAKEHLDTLNSEIDRFATKKPYAFHVITEYGSNRSHDVEWLREPPLRWSAIVGDCVHNLRSALDHIVWALSGGDGNAPSHAEFPIFIDEEKYLKRTKEGEPARGSGLWKIQAVSAFKGKAVFYRLQPFNGTDDPTRHPLWILHELDRVDKHRRLHVVGGTAFIDLWQRGVATLEDLPLGWRQVYATASPEYPTEVLAGHKTKVKVRADLAMRITLESEAVPADECVDVVLARLIEFVESEVLARFAPFL